MNACEPRRRSRAYKFVGNHHQPPPYFTSFLKKESLTKITKPIAKVNKIFNLINNHLDGDQGVISMG
ncbi:hypothetical protein HanRHA438_Chr14g0666811 [Helianthus annuus]|nr:hypothetical protein HanRHA438_Chr14g0666811 [Helianthus annuus]